MQLTIAEESSAAPPPPDVTDPSAIVWRDGDGTIVAIGQTLGDRHWVHVPSLGAFTFLRAAGGITAVPDPGADPAVVEDAYRRMVLPLALQAQGREVLHASAVRAPAGVIALCARSGTGKSTLACALSGRGHLLWADDAVCFEAGDSGIEAAPLPFTLRLRPASAEFFGDRGDGGLHEAKKPEPLAAVFVLERSEDGPPRIERVAPSDAFPAVLTHGYSFTVDDRERTRAMMRSYLELVDRVAVFRLTFSPGLDQLDYLVELIEGAAR